MRVNQSGDQLLWEVIRGKNRNFPVRKSSIRVTFPEAITEFIDVTASIKNSEIRITPENEIVFVTENIPGSRPLRIGTEIPHGIIRTSAQAWQAESEQALRVQASANLILLIVGILILLGGSIGIFLHWHVAGRDQTIGVVPQTLTEPPSDLAPGLMGTLIDEHSDMKDTVATVVDLANRGILRIVEIRETGRLDFKIEIVAPAEALPRFERKVVSGIFGYQSEKKLTEVGSSFYRTIPEVQNRMYEALVKRGHFLRSPEDTRVRYRNISLVGAIVTGLYLLLGIGLLAPLASLWWLPGISLAAVVALLFLVSRNMPRKTNEGSLEARKWQAFKRYLEQLDKHQGLEESSKIFERYLPYAIAFGIKNNWIDQFASLPTPAPEWYVPLDWSGGGSPALPTGNVSIDLDDAPSLDDISKGLASSLQSINANFAAMLNMTGNTLGIRAPGGTDVKWSNSGDFDLDIGSLLEIGIEIVGGIAEAGSGFG
jgi:hypothetical protein